MSIVHSYSVGNGDMFSIRHNSDNCTIIDCCIGSDNKSVILEEIDKQRLNKGITRFISTHPDQDHIQGLIALDDHIKILNFYVVENFSTKTEETIDFNRYKMLRDGDKAFHIYKDCSRKWMDKSDDERESSGISILWPDTSNNHFKEALKSANAGNSPNNISPIIVYSLENGVTMAWFGDLETEFMEKIESEVEWPDADIIFAPHHGRDSGKIPESILELMKPQIVIIGEAPASNLNYYGNYNTITQNSAGTISFDCQTDWVHIYVDSSTYSVNFLQDQEGNLCKHYLGSLQV